MMELEAMEKQRGLEEHTKKELKKGVERFERQMKESAEQMLQEVRTLQKMRSRDKSDIVSLLNNCYSGVK